MVRESHISPLLVAPHEILCFCVKALAFTGFFAYLNSSHGILSMIYGFLRKYRLVAIATLSHKNFHIITLERSNQTGALDKSTPNSFLFGGRKRWNSLQSLVRFVLNCCTWHQPISFELPPPPPSGPYLISRYSEYNLWHTPSTPDIYTEASPNFRQFLMNFRAFSRMFDDF